MKRLLMTVAAVASLAAPMTALAQDRHEDGHDRGGARPAGGQPHYNAPAPQAQPQARPQIPGGQGGYRPQAGYQGGPRFPGGQGGYRPQAGQAGYQGGSQLPGGQGGYRPQAGQTGYQGGPRFPGGQGGYRPQAGQSGYQGQGYQGQGYQGQGYQGRGGDFGRNDDRGGYRDGDHGGYRDGYRGGEGFRGGGRRGGVAFSYGGRSFYRYRADAYSYPYAYRGWEHHYWRRGEFLPSAFFLPNYFIDDYYDFGLWEPDYGYQWIRVGADALLINLATGEVVDSVPGVYYY